MIAKLYKEKNVIIQHIEFLLQLAILQSFACSPLPPPKHNAKSVKCFKKEQNFSLVF